MFFQWITKSPLFITEPYAEYKIWIKAYTIKNEGKSSEPVDVTTDVVAPGQPIGMIARKMSKMIIIGKKYFMENIKQI